MTELEELLPGARTLPKRVRKIVVEWMSDALIGDTPQKSKSQARYSCKIRMNWKGS